MKTVTMHEAKTHLSRLVKEIREGKEAEIIISIGDTPAARLMPYERAGRRVLGVDRGLIQFSDDFDAVDQEIADLFEGKLPPKRRRN
jgi:antitoxin (DNA-binding transcriptional repressor) of toxin-antitoxin stability system